MFSGKYPKSCMYGNQVLDLDSYQHFHKRRMNRYCKPGLDSISYSQHNFRVTETDTGDKQNNPQILLISEWILL